MVGKRKTALELKLEKAAAAAKKEQADAGVDRLFSEDDAPAPSSASASTNSVSTVAPPAQSSAAAPIAKVGESSRTPSATRTPSRMKRATKNATPSVQGSKDTLDEKVDPDPPAKEAKKAAGKKIGKKEKEPAAAKKTASKKGKVTWADDSLEEKPLATPKRTLTPGDRRQMRAGSGYTNSKTKSPGGALAPQRIKIEDEDEEGVLQGRSRELGTPSSASKSVAFREDVDVTHIEAAGKSRAVKRKKGLSPVDEDGEDAANDGSPLVLRGRGQEPKRLKKDVSSPLFQPQASPVRTDWFPDRQGTTPKQYATPKQSDPSRVANASPSEAKLPPKRSSLLSRGDGAITRLMLNEENISADAEGGSDASSAKALSEEERRHAEAVADLKRSNVQRFMNSPFRLKRNKVTNQADAVGVPSGAGTSSSSTAKAASSTSSSDLILAKNTQQNKQYLLPILDDEQKALLGLYRTIDQLITMYRQLRSRRTAIADLRKNAERSSGRQLTTSRLRRILFVAKDFLRAERLSQHQWNPLREDPIVLEHGDEDVQLSQTDPDSGGKLVVHLAEADLSTRWRTVAERLGQYGQRDVPHADLPERPETVAEAAAKEMKNFLTPQASPSASPRGGSIRVSSASGRRLNISDKAKHKEKIAGCIKKLDAERSKLEEKVDELSRLLEVMPLIQVSFDQRGRPGFMSYTDLLQELTRNNKNNLSTDTLATVLERYSAEVPDWLSIKVSNFDADVKTVHVRHDFNYGNWRRATSDQREVHKQRMQSIDNEKKTLFVVD
ncbi:unnamed protein product [Amoebophrya sp. A25]|nr:unnamed protein product [Amoebophrya sp. A25]|eukprot:GSA25T00000968001.1